ADSSRGPSKASRPGARMARPAVRAGPLGSGADRGRGWGAVGGNGAPPVVPHGVDRAAGARARSRAGYALRIRFGGGPSRGGALHVRVAPPRRARAVARCVGVFQPLRPPGGGRTRASRVGYIFDVSLVCTPAIVLRTYRYSETSKIVRLATRDYGVQSAIAKGVLRPRSPFGAALETLSEGVAQLYHKDTRELQTLAAFDVIQLRRDLAADLGRFAGATALAEVILKMAPPAPLPAAYDAFIQGLDALAGAPAGQADAVAVRWLWLVVGVLGFAPQLDTCVRDGNELAPPGSSTVAFSIMEGGGLCPSCAGLQPPTRLPAQAYRDLVMLNDVAAELPTLDKAHAAAHRRLVARFIRHHLDESVAHGNGREPKSTAIDIWERGAWVGS